MLLKRSLKLQHVQESAVGFSYAFYHVFIDAPEKLLKFGAYSTLGTALPSLLQPPSVPGASTSPAAVIRLQEARY